MGDSSAMLSYFMNDVKAELRRPVVQLEMALERQPKNGLMLWDDFCGAAGHSITALAQWLGREQAVSEHLLDEKHAGCLSSERMKTLQSLRVRLAFAVARTAGLTTLAEAIKKFGLAACSVTDPFEKVNEVDDLFAANSKVLPNAIERDDLRDFLATKSRQLLASNLTRATNPWSSEKLEQRLLGYGNSARLLVFFYNVPTVTLTPLWKGNDDDWSALFPRRAKPSFA